MTSLVPIELIEQKILSIRGQRVMLDADLATLYDVESKVLNQAISRQIRRFPEECMLRLTDQEFTLLRSQFVTSSQWGGRRYAPYAFTEQGVAMLSSVLNSDRAIEANIAIMRTFVKLRQMISSHKELSAKLEEMEKLYDAQFRTVFTAIRELMAPSEPKKKRPIGFGRESE